MRYGTLSAKASEQLFGNKGQEGMRVHYDPHPTWYGAIKVYRDSDGAFIGGYVSVGPDGIIDSEGR